MKKLMFITSIFALAGCGNNWEVTKKNWNSDFGDLKRSVKVYDSISKDVLWEYTGDVYVPDTCKVGDITIIYRDPKGKVRKNDFMGRHIALSMWEVAD